VMGGKPHAGATLHLRISRFPGFSPILWILAVLGSAL
jgi:hypothetical protein